jgi:predicted acyltransferase
MENAKSKRLTSLDVLRGIAIASMIIVNNPGSWQHVYSPLLHAKWHGFTPTDLVFPLFLFIVGMSMAFSFSKYTPGDRTPSGSIYRRIFRRSALLFVLGLLLNSLSLILDWLLNDASLDFKILRIMGVLQRIGIAYFLATLIVIKLSSLGRWSVATIILLGYWGAMQFVPVPGYGAGTLSPEGNLAAYIDRLILTPGHMYFGGPYDPEGLTSTLPAVTTVLAGYFTGEWLRVQPVNTQASTRLALAGLNCLIVGYLWGFVFPVNKALWTSSYVVFTAGWALLLLTVCYETIEVRGWRRWGWPFEVMGLNAIFLFVASGIVGRILYKTHVGSGSNVPTTYTWIYRYLFLPWANPTNASLAFALTTLFLWWFVLYILYQRRWFFKV